MKLLLIGLLTISGMSFAQQKKEDAILGEWLTASKDGKVQIYKQGDAYFGKITGGTKETKTDTKNPEPSLRNRDLLGLIILKDFHYNNKGKWEDGTIYDPNNGKTYSCIIGMKDNHKLEVRGYVGISLFGRTEEWTR